MSSTISKLLEIRKVTEIARKDGRLEMLSTQEQLRSKHIETLEQLQVLTDENESLRRDIHSLHVKFGVVCDDSIGDIEADVTGNSDDDSLLLRKIHAQDKEIKELKSRLSLAESETRDVKEQSKALRQQEFDTRKKLEKDKSENEVASRKASIASIALYEATNQILQKSLQNRDSELQSSYSERSAEEKKLQDVKDQVRIREEQILKLKEEKAAALLQQQKLLDTISQMESQIEDVKEMSAEQNRASQIIVDLMAGEYAELELGNERLLSKMSSLQVENESSNFENAKLRSEIMKLREENMKLSKDSDDFKLHSTQVSSSFITENENIFIPPTSPVSVGNVVSLIESAKGGDFCIGGKGFEEFVKLKKENKTLKLQIVHLQQSRSGSVSALKKS